MRITADMLIKKARVEPEAEEVKERSAAVTRYFKTLGLEVTALASEVIPHIARREMDLIGDENKPFDRSRKGVLMMGHVGTGKTIMLKVAARIIGCEYHDITSLSALYATYGDSAFWGVIRPDRTDPSSDDLIIDDFGSEAEVRRYGNVLPIVDMIYARYDDWNNYGRRLWMATNLTGAELSARYGERVMDRLKEMCVVVSAPGDSMRK
jgi:DNA replication protein DnaC